MDKANIKPAAAKKKTRRPKKKAPAKQPSPNLGAPVSQNVTVKGQKGSAIREQGTDLLVQIDVDGARGMVIQTVLTPEILPRLGKMAGSFQRIQYHRLRFEIVTGLPSTSTGCYVAGFVKDATDPIEEQPIPRLLAAGGVATKWWQSSEVDVTSLPGLFYTSSNPVDERWASPGSFAVAAIGASGKGTIAVYVHWDVTLSQPSYEGKGSRQGFVTANVDMFTTDKNGYLSKRAGNDWAQVKYNDFTPPLKEGDLATALSMRFFGAYGQGAKEMTDVRAFRTLRARGTFVMPQNDKREDIPEFSWGNNWVIFKGEELSLTAAPNALTASWFRSTSARYQHWREAWGPSMSQEKQILLNPEVSLPGQNSCSTLSSTVTGLTLSNRSLPCQPSNLLPSSLSSSIEILSGPTSLEVATS